MARYRHYLRRPRAFLEFLARGLFAPHFAAIVCSFTQAHTAFLSSSVSFASGCITAYVRGGILPVDTSPHMDSNLSRFCRIEYVSHSEKSSFSLPARTCCAIHQETGRTWLYKASQSDWSGSFRKPAPRLASAVNSTQAAVPDFPGRYQHAARSPLVQQSRLWPPTRQLISASSL